MNTEESKQLAYSALSGLGMPIWDERKGEDSEKYIIVANIYNGEDNFSDDEAGEETHHFYVYCFVSREEKSLLDSYMDSIRNALKSAGFDLVQHNVSTIDDLQSEYTGRYSEFSIWG
jgi:hypothetical protein